MEMYFAYIIAECAAKEQDRAEAPLVRFLTGPLFLQITPMVSEGSIVLSYGFLYR
jgi:hypothetical protein